MIVVSYEREMTVPPITSNPFSLYSSGFEMLLSGRMAVVNTGIKMALPSDLALSVSASVREDIVVVAASVRDKAVRLVVVAVGDEGIHFVRPGERLAVASITEAPLAAVRCLEFRNGRMIKYGDAAPVRREKDGSSDEKPSDS